MPPKAKIPQPIDRPLSRAYLREFGGWSTEYPPGLSDPTSLRLMENVWIGRDGSARVRPGLRYLSYLTSPDEETSTVGTAISEQIVGTHETFYLNDSTQAYLFAVREVDGTVGFRVLVRNDSASVVQELTDTGIDFDIPQGEAAIRFTSATTYVKYLQIDNKIFALSNAGETMRLFNVGSTKSAHRLAAITRPEWTVEDKLGVVEPDGPWIDSGLPDTKRYNLLTNPSFEVSLKHWIGGDLASATRSQAVTPESGAWVAAVESTPTKTNYATRPLTAGSGFDTSGWFAVSNLDAPSVTGSGYLRFNAPTGSNPRNAVARSTKLAVKGGKSYKVAVDVGDFGTESEFRCIIRPFTAEGFNGFDIDVPFNGSGSRVVTPAFEIDSGYTQVQIRPYIKITKTGLSHFEFRNVTLVKNGVSTAHFDGDSGTNYYWQGTSGASASDYHPPADIVLTHDKTDVEVGVDYTASAGFRAAATVRACSTGITWFKSNGDEISSAYGTPANDSTSGWTRPEYSLAAPAAASAAKTLLKIAAVPRGETHYVDAAMLEKNTSAGTFFDGDTVDTSTEQNSWYNLPRYYIAQEDAQSEQTLFADPAAIPTAESPAAGTLISNDPDLNDYSFGFFYTFSNQIGESAPSQVTVVKAQRPWSGWLWETADTDGSPSGTATTDPTACADQLVAYMPESVFDQALVQGAIGWTLYMVTWSDQDVVPSSAVRVAYHDLSEDSVYEVDGWARVTPQQVGAGELVVPIPSMDTLVNYSDPPRGGQGLVAADRMIVVLDPTQQARIKWSSNVLGHYTDFSSILGGGFKTLVSGNLYVPAVVKLWQNPQSVDTLTILCMGTDGRSTGYYMAPAQISQQSESTTVMAFEETTATPGTTSPFGCEVFNNALYHPLDDQLMKSTATNYNINHKSVTDQIKRQWSKLVNKHRIGSSQHDSRLYFIVHNPEGEALEENCRGNEIWVYDAGTDAGTWSRWIIQAIALRKIERNGQVYMSVVRPDGIYYLDPEYGQDDFVDDGDIAVRYIPWLLETNTQGANRAHDAWCHLEQANVTFGNLLGTVEYGVRGWDVNGKPVTRSKRITVDGDPDLLPFDRDDYLRIGRQMKEWFFFARSVEEDGLTLPSAGQLNLVQYRYTPISVNVGYAYGSVETFEYGRSLVVASEQLTDAGVPQPYIDTGRP